MKTLYFLTITGLIQLYADRQNDESDAGLYSLISAVSDIIRVFSDGKIQIKNLADNEITETDYETFVGYYDEDEHEHHDCGCGHEYHGHDCDCGNH